MAPDQMNPVRGDALSMLQLELIAELVEGVLDGTERREVLRLLKESPAAYDVYVETVAAMRGVGQPTEEPGPNTAADGIVDEAPSDTRPELPSGALDLRSRSRVDRMRKAQRLIPLASAAGIGLVALGIGLMTGLWDGSNSAAVQVGAFPAQALTAALGSEHPLSSARGAVVPGSDEGRAFRLGVRVMDVEGAIRADESDAARDSQEQVVSLLESLNAPSPVLFSYREPFDALTEDGRIEAEEGVESWLSGAPPRLARYRLGRGAEALRFAVHAGDPGLIRRSSRNLDPAYLEGLGPDARDSAEVLLSLASAGRLSPPEAIRVDRLLRDFFSTVSR